MDGRKGNLIQSLRAFRQAARWSGARVLLIMMMVVVVEVVAACVGWSVGSFVEVVGWVVGLLCGLW